MKTFKKNGDKFNQRAQHGKRTQWGKPVLRRKPTTDTPISDEDPFLRLDGIAQGKRESLTNEEIDGIITTA